MKSGQELYNEHLNRIKKATALEKTDRPPVVLNVDSFAVRFMGGKLSDLCLTPEYGNDLIIKGILSLGNGNADGTGMGAIFPQNNGIFALSKIKIPGRELAGDMLWQIDEKGYMTEEDYDTVIKKGWAYFFSEYCKKYLAEGLAEVNNFARIAPKINQKYADAGIVALTGGVIAGGPFAPLCSGRGIAKFMMDLHRIPDKVKAAMDVMFEETVQRLNKQLPESKDFAVFTGGAREAGDFLSPKLFEKFAWPYFKRGVEMVVKAGKIAYLHLDLSWDRYLDYFLELPKGRCIFHTDSTTDIFKAKEILQGHLCFMGNVSPSLLTLGTPDEVYAYSKRLVDEFAPDGFIMAAGCSVPANAKPENVKAMLAAAGI